MIIVKLCNQTKSNQDDIEIKNWWAQLAQIKWIDVYIKYIIVKIF